ncbi:APAF1-interacting protein [Cordyceps militaris CM01]|uniref:Methylthioribulose-1-phosphate dehydratase n=1 Tax=Cordyceps militaris (strain CM01) TaxID=983644 RepID=G3JJU3_CORMM|nr:APAF1-interacting protein [Cordyceps militaris CM01]EGX92127.1 APAF1-interacting protein [Cordyceps militaris CM01]
MSVSDADKLITSDDQDHPANLIPALCAKFWTLGWVTGTGGGCSIRDECVIPHPSTASSFPRPHPRPPLPLPRSAQSTHMLTAPPKSDLVYLAPSGVQKELMKPADIYVLSLSAQDPTQPLRSYLRSPPSYRPSQCTPLFLAAFTRRGAGCCIHTHSQWAVLVTLLLEQHEEANRNVFEVNNIEQIKGFGRGPGRAGNLGYHDTLRIPVIENTPHEEDLTEYLEEAMEAYPDTYAVLVRRHGVYVWGDNVHKAKTQCESVCVGYSLDYLFQLAVEMKKLGIPWISDIPRIAADRT